ncbi:MAG: heat-inducible transcriptional repressor HrcA [Thermoleophilia bacterium]
MSELTSRQAKIIAAVIEHYVSTGRPVGSRYLFDEGGFGVAPSTLRTELARLERMGYLSHPHTSAGRVPTDSGYRFYVDNTARQRRHSASQELTEQMEGELEDALRHVTGVLARTTGLLAMVSAPSQDSCAIRHVEVLQLQPDQVMVVIITDAGGIAKKLFVFSGPVDSGLLDWARGFLNDAVCGLDLGSRRLGTVLMNPDLSPAEREFVEAIAPAFAQPGGAALYLEGVSRLFTQLQEAHSPQARSLMEILDRQDEILGLLREASREKNIYLRIGGELSQTAMRDCSLVAANYGVDMRNLGTVGVLGPTRMDYPSVIGCVRHTAWSLSRFMEEIYQ